MKSIHENGKGEKDSPVYDCLADNACISAQDQFSLITSQGYVSLLCLAMMDLKLLILYISDSFLVGSATLCLCVTHTGGRRSAT